MPVATSASEKENTPATGAARVKQENAHKGKRRVNVEVADASEPEGSSPRGTKRSRVNTDGDSRATATAEDEDGGERVKEDDRVLIRDTDDFVPGSIVRINLLNFVTYDQVEFRPGPYLNMIVGPNGTGKSSIACAIALGLNWPPSILGRSKDITGFVKQGANEGSIEIELKGKPGQPNLIIKRGMTTRSKASTYTINGKPASGKEVSAKMEELNVSVGNLCSFLPQDRVQSFAAMSPQDLLKETQRAAGNPNLTNWHATLINQGNEFREQAEHLKNETEQLQQMRDRNAAIEREVERFKERKRLEHEIEFLELLIPVQLYREERETYMNLKKDQRAAHQKVIRLRDRNKPAHDLLAKLEAQVEQHEKTHGGLKKTLQKRLEKMKKKWEDSENIEAEMETHKIQLDALQKEKEAAAQRIRKHESDLEKMGDALQNMLERQKTLENDGELRDQRNALDAERQPLIERTQDLEGQMRENIQQKANANVTAENIRSSLKRLDNVDDQKMQNLKRWNADAHAALIWLRNNQQRFSQPIMEPPCISMTVPDKRYADAVENCMSAGQLQSFVAQNKADYDLFNKLLQDDKVLGRDVILSVWYRDAREIEAPMSREELAAQHFDGYVLDFLQYPDGLQPFLRAELQLHRTAVALKNHTRVNLDEVMALVTRGGGQANFITHMTMHQVKRSAYGNRGIQNMTRNMKNAKTLSAQSVDHERQAELKRELAEAAQKLTLLEEQHTDLLSQLKETEAEDKKFEGRYGDLKKRIDVLKEFHKQKSTLESRMNRVGRALEDMKNQPSADEKRTELKTKLSAAGRKRIGYAREYLALAKDVIAAQNAFTKAGLQHVQNVANRDALKMLCDQKGEKYTQALKDFRTIDDQFNEAKLRSKEALNNSREAMAQYEEEDTILQEYRVIETRRLRWEADVKEASANGQPEPSREEVDLRTLEQLKEELDRQKAALEITLASNPGVVEAYEKRLKDIERLEESIENRQRSSDKIEANISNARKRWLPALEKLVSSINDSFSAAMDDIKCVGEVKIGKHEDFDKWAIEIWVSFRDSEKLQPLTSQRQSGGERSLTTMLYLMSLNQECRAPFSLVDEINQGMDQFYERTIHNSLVKATCKPDSGQFFLITPKLLAGLAYHEKMKMLCVGNGEWLPEEQGVGNLMNVLTLYRGARGMGRASH